MNPDPTETEFLKSYDPSKYDRPSIAADAIVFSYFARQLHVLLIQRKNHPFRGHWVFPGGFIEVYEDPGEAVRRELREETGIEVDDLFQLGAFGRPDRDPRYHVISIAYIGIARGAAQEPQADDDAMNAAWYPVRKTPPLGFDHEEILDAALARLRREIARPSFAVRFLAGAIHDLPSKKLCVTGADLHALYEEILGRKLDPARFLRRLSRICGENPSLTRRIRINRPALRKFESSLGSWWL